MGEGLLPQKTNDGISDAVHSAMHDTAADLRPQHCQKKEPLSAVNSHNPSAAALGPAAENKLQIRSAAHSVTGMQTRIFGLSTM